VCKTFTFTFNVNFRVTRKWHPLNSSYFNCSYSTILIILNKYKINTYQDDALLMNVINQTISIDHKSIFQIYITGSPAELTLKLKENFEINFYPYKWRPP